MSRADHAPANSRSRLWRALAWAAYHLARWERWIAGALGLAACVCGVATYLALAALPPMGRDPDTIAWLLSVDLVLLLSLGGLVARRVSGVLRDRRQGRGASRLQARLVGLFALLATAPAILLVLFSTFLFQLGLQSWFSGQVSTAVGQAQAVAEAYLNEHRKVISADLQAMAYDIDRQSGLILADPAARARFMDTQSFLRNFDESVIFEGSGRVIARGGVGLRFDPDGIPPGVLQSTAAGEVAVYTDAAPGQAEERIEAIIPLATVANTYLYASRAVDPVVLSYVAATRDAANNYHALQERSAHLQFQFFAVYVLVALLLLMAAVWGGVYWSSQLVRPIDGLILAAEQVREGQLDVRVSERQGVDEFDELARTFNRMTAQLAQQRHELIAANHKLDQRRRFTETILAGVSSGVMALDAKGIIRLANEPAATILGRLRTELPGCKIAALLPDLDLARVPIDRTGLGLAQEVPLARLDHQHRTLLVRLARDFSRPDAEGADGLIMTFDDITELQSAQRKSAWADVARRVAHEIKNPLTPIQLSAERLRRRFFKDIPTDDQPVFQQCVDTIIRHVGDIGRMVGEFASFARMPEPIMKTEDMGALLRDVTTLIQDSAPGLSIQLDGSLTRNEPLPLLMDSSLMRQAITNLLLNAADSVTRRMTENPQPAGQIFVTLERREGQYILSILDNGLGFPRGVALEQLTEPYVTFREKGTGLGLAIVKKIVQDHKGSLRLDGPDGVRARANWNEHGALVSLILPIPLETSPLQRQDTAHAA